MRLPKNSGFMWLALVTYVASVVDGYLTTKFSAELNPLLSPIFVHGPYGILFAKAALVPLFLFLGDMAGRHKLARYGLLVCFGWCMAVVVIELAQLAAST